MAMHDLASVIVRFHDPLQRSRLERCLLSLLGQRRSGVETVLVLQDFSDTQLRSLDAWLDRFGWSATHSRPRLINVARRGASDIRSRLLNAGIVAARGRYLGFLDYDDCWYANALSHLVGRLEASGAAIAFARVRRTLAYPLERYDYTYAKEQPFRGASVAELMVDNFCPIHSFLVDRTQVPASELRFDEEMGVLEDYDFLLRTVSACAADFGGVEEVIGEYQWRSDGSNTTPVAATADDERHRVWESARRRIAELKTRLATTD